MIKIIAMKAYGWTEIEWFLSQIFPINMKGSAGSLVTLVSWLGSWIISYAFNFLMNWSSAGNAKMQTSLYFSVKLIYSLQTAI